MTIRIRTAEGERDVRGALPLYHVDDAKWRLNRYGDAEPLTHDEIEDDFVYWWNIYETARDGFFIAVDDERDLIVGVASSARRPPQWILTNFFVHPDYKSRGIGHKLLERAYAVQDGCTRFTVHASDDPAAQALYMRFGMYPKPHSTQFKGQLPSNVDLPRNLEVAKVSPLEVLDTFNPLDRAALGFEREIDHHIWAKSGQYYVAKGQNERVGYFRIGRSSIGPLVVTEDRWMGDTLQAALVLARADSNQQTLLVPGANMAAIARLLGWGYRCHDVELLMSSAPLPGLSRVIFQDTDVL